MVSNGSLPLGKELTADEAEALAVDGVRPRVQVAPSSEQELADVVRQAADEHLAIVARGGGTLLDLGMPPRQLDVVVSTERLDRVLDYEPANLVVSAQAGVHLADLQQMLGAKGQFLPLDPPSGVPPFDGRATLGGLIAANASGPFRLAYGTARDLVIGLRFVTGAGEIAKSGGKVVKNVAGYDLNKLLVGSLGTLAILTELAFKLAPLPEVEETVAASFETLEAAATAVRATLRSPHQPAALEMLDWRVTCQVAPTLIPAEERCLVLAAVSGLGVVVRRQVEALKAISAQHGALDVGPVGPDAPAIWQAIRGFGRNSAVGLLCRASLPPAQVPTLMGLAARLGGMALAHAGNGVVLISLPAGTVEPAVAARMVQELRAAARAADGSLVVERAPVALKTLVDVWDDPGPAIELMRRVKAQFDPHNILSPGRFVGRM